MKLIETSQYLRTRKRLIKKHSLTDNTIDAVLTLWIDNPKHPSLHFKPMTCKKDKERYSIRIPNTQYRILMNLTGDEARLVCVCDHSDYDRRNKNC